MSKTYQPAARKRKKKRYKSGKILKTGYHFSKVSRSCIAQSFKQKLVQLLQFIIFLSLLCWLVSEMLIQYEHESAGIKPLESSLRDGSLKVNRNYIFAGQSCSKITVIPKIRARKDKSLRSHSSQAHTCWLIRISTATLRSPSAAAIATSTCV